MFTTEAFIPFAIGVLVGVLGYVVLAWAWTHIYNFFKGSKKETTAPSGGGLIPRSYYATAPPDNTPVYQPFHGGDDIDILKKKNTI